MELVQLAGVREAFVSGLPAGDRGEDVAAVVVPDGSETGYRVFLVDGVAQGSAVELEDRALRVDRRGGRPRLPARRLRGRMIGQDPVASRASCARRELTGQVLASSNSVSNDARSTFPVGSSGIWLSVMKRKWRGTLYEASSARACDSSWS